VDGVHIWTDSESLRRTALVYGGDSSKDSGPAIVLGALRLAPRSSGSSVWVLKGAGPVRAGEIRGDSRVCFSHTRENVES
jgi:hypothetical protein